MLRRFGNAILAAALLAVCATGGVRASAYDSVAVQDIGGDAAYGATPEVVASSSSGSDSGSIPPVTDAPTPTPVIINVEEEPVTAPPSTMQPPASESGSGSAAPTTTIEGDEVGNEGDATQSAYSSPAATPAATATLPAATPSATTPAPVATPAATTPAPAATTAAPTPAATPAATTATTTAPPPFTTNNLTPTVTPAATTNTSPKKRKDCDPQFPEEEPAPVTPAPSVPTPAATPAATTPAATPAATTTVTSNNGVVKAPSDSDALDVSTSNIVAYAQSAPAPSADDDAPVVKISAKSDEGSEDSSSGNVGATAGIVGTVAAIAVVGTAFMHIKKKREEALLSTPREQFGELRATPAGNAAL